MVAGIGKMLSVSVDTAWAKRSASSEFVVSSILLTLVVGQTLVPSMVDLMIFTNASLEGW